MKASLGHINRPSEGEGKVVTLIMRHNSVRRFVIGSCITVGLFSYTAWPDAAPARRTDRNWAAEQLDECRKRILGSPSCSDPWIRGHGDVRVLVIQAWTDDFLDMSLAATIEQREISSLRIVSAVGAPIFDQLCRLHVENPDSEPADAFKLVRVSEIVLGADEIAQLAPMLVDLSEHTVRAADADADVTVWIHGLHVTSLLRTAEDCQSVRLSLPRTDAQGSPLDEEVEKQLWELLHWVDEQVGLSRKVNTTVP